VTPLQPLRDIPVKPSDSLAERIGNLGLDFSQFAKKLDTADQVAVVFQNLNQTPASLDSPLLNVIIQLPAESKWQDVNSHYHSANLLLLLPFSPSTLSLCLQTYPLSGCHL
jgi:hypothetical protein